MIVILRCLNGSDSDLKDVQEIDDRDKYEKSDACHMQPTECPLLTVRTLNTPDRKDVTAITTRPDQLHASAVGVARHITAFRIKTLRQ